MMKGNYFLHTHLYFKYFKIRTAVLDQISGPCLVWYQYVSDSGQYLILQQKPLL